jgi:hypothetical protein
MINTNTNTNPLERGKLKPRLLRPWAIWHRLFG